MSIESEAGFRALFEYATIGIVVINREGQIELANPCIQNMFGYTNGELIGKPVEILIPDALRSRHIDHRESYFARPKARPMGYGLNLFARKKDGAEFPVEISLGHYQLDSEKLAVAFVTDITIRKANEEKYLNLFENSLVAMFLTEINSLKVIDVNEMGIRLFGYKSKDDFLKNFKPVQHFIRPEERETNMESLVEQDTNEITREQEMQKLDGTRFWAKIFVKLNNEKSLAQTVAIDITETRRAQEELESKVEERTLELTQSLDREKQLGEMKSRFVSMASHEFRTPLSAILSSVSLIDRYSEPENEEKRKKHIERIKSSVQNLTDILNDFLSLDKLEQGKVEVEKELVDMKEFVEGILEEMNENLKEGQKINYDHEGENEIFQDRKIIRSIMLNLVSNAVKYSGENDEITLKTNVADHQITFTVKDQGIGIPSEEQNHMFTKFFRAKNALNIKGTGLGLTIVKRYVELLDGEISFTSSMDTGTTFIVKFPH